MNVSFVPFYCIVCGRNFLHGTVYNVSVLASLCCRILLSYLFIIHCISQHITAVLMLQTVSVHFLFSLSILQNIVISCLTSLCTLFASSLYDYSSKEIFQKTLTFLFFFLIQQLLLFCYRLMRKLCESFVFFPLIFKLLPRSWQARYRYI